MGEGQLTAPEFTPQTTKQMPSRWVCVAAACLLLGACLPLEVTKYLSDQLLKAAHRGGAIPA